MFSLIKNVSLKRQHQGTTPAFRYGSFQVERKEDGCGAREEVSGLEEHFKLSVATDVGLIETLTGDALSQQAEYLCEHVALVGADVTAQDGRSHLPSGPVPSVVAQLQQVVLFAGQCELKNWKVAADDGGW